LYKHISGGNTQDLLENADNLLFLGHKALEVTEKPSEQTEEPVKENPEAEDQASKPTATINQDQIHYVKFITSDFAMQNVII